MIISLLNKNTGDNSIIVILGANLHLMNDDINNCESLIKNAKVLVTNLEIPVETALYSLKLAKLNNCKLNFIELLIKFLFFSSTSIINS